MGYRQYIFNSMDALIETSRASKLWFLQFMLVGIAFSGFGIEEITGVNVEKRMGKLMRNLADMEEDSKE